MKIATTLLMSACVLYIAGTLGISTAASQPSSAQAHPFSSAARQKAEELLKQMTLDEKIGQLDQTSGIVMPGIATEKPDNLILQGKVGSMAHRR